MPSTIFLSSAEAAYVAELSEPLIQRAVEDQVVYEPLIRQGSEWSISRLAAAFIAFYCKTEQHDSQRSRKSMLASSISHITASGNLKRAMALKLSSTDKLFDLVLAQHIAAATIRSHKLDRALRSISVSDNVMWGMPVFSGTRVPVDTVVGSLEEGTSLAELKESYAFLTEDLVESAQIYTQVHPMQGRARRMSESHPDWKISSITVIHLSENELAPVLRRMSFPTPCGDGN
jgi:uncharacterized protein (DUF433 family)